MTIDTGTVARSPRTTRETADLVVSAWGRYAARVACAPLACCLMAGA
ncbi:MAG: hypothetical protein ACTHK4_13605 [Mycobacteriales bacterium]